jgi:transcriptional regulator with XRE-family HTH domain
MRSEPVEHWRHFGAHLRQLRQAQGWTLRQFAKAVGIAPGYQCTIEQGLAAPPSLAILERMAEALDLPLNHLCVHAGKLSRATWWSVRESPPRIWTG